MDVPTFVEEKGINPYWICNRYENHSMKIAFKFQLVVISICCCLSSPFSQYDHIQTVLQNYFISLFYELIEDFHVCSLCLRKRKMVPTGIAIFRGLSNFLLLNV